MANFNNPYQTPSVSAYNNYGTPAYAPAPAVPRYYPQQAYEPQYVTGIEGANAFQMPPGVTKIILWDTDKDSFYVKMLDEMGRPKVVAWKDFADHVEPPREVQSSPDLSVYPTKKDLEDMLDKFDTSKYLTKDDLETALNQLVVGERGRVVRSNEFTA